MSAWLTLNCLSRCESLRPVFLRKKRRPMASAAPNRFTERTREENENRCSVSVVQDRFVAGHELQLVEEPKSVAQQEDDGEQQCVGDHREFLGAREWFSGITLVLVGAGGKPGSNGGPPEARRLFRWQSGRGWDCGAAGGARADSEGQRWRAEVGPSCRCPPATSWFACGLGFSFECLVFAEVGDGHSERIDRNQFVGDVGFEKEDKVRGVQIALQLAMVGGRVIDHVEVHARAKGRVCISSSATFFTSTSISGAAVLVMNFLMMSSLR